MYRTRDFKALKVALNEGHKCFPKGRARWVSTARYPYWSGPFVFRHKGNDGTNREYYFWNHYGSSAQRVTDSELRWIFKTLFKAGSYEFEIHD